MKRIFSLIFILTFIFTACKPHVVPQPIQNIEQNQPVKPQPIDTVQPVKPQPQKPTSDQIRSNLLDTLNKQLYVRESWGPNRGPEVDNYLRTVNCPIENPWCAAFVGANLFWQDVKNPKSAWAPDYAAEKDIIWKEKIKIKDTPKTGDVTTYYYSNIGRIGHAGFFEKIDKDGYFITIEGNTNGAGSREGDGVYRKKRETNKVYAVSRYIK